MKKTLALLAILVVSHMGFAQDDPDVPRRDIKKNEFSLNPFNLIAFGAIDIGYERILNSNTTMALNYFHRISDSTDDNDDDYDIIDTDGIFDKEIALTARFKYFFGNRIARGFYVEAFGSYSSGDHDREIEVRDSNGFFVNYVDINEEFSDFALGFGVGGKFVSRNGFFLDIGVGVGRNLFTEESPNVIFRPNLHIGYRF